MKTNILELEKKYWQGMEDKDYETVRSLTRFPCIVAGKNGVQSVDEASFKAMFEKGLGAKYEVVNFEGEEIQSIGDNCAVIAYRIDIARDNESEPLHCACTSTWAKENDGWVCVMHTESELAMETV